MTPRGKDMDSGPELDAFVQGQIDLNDNSNLHERKVAWGSLVLDMTSVCDQPCNNCNRQCSQAPGRVFLELEQIQRFLDESRALNWKWQRIRLSGGEPTYHPNLQGAIDIVAQFNVTIILVTNLMAHSSKVVPTLDYRGRRHRIHGNPNTEGRQRPFHPINIAPRDLQCREFTHEEYSYGCAIAELCGICLSSYGIYSCPIMSGLDRVLGFNVGMKELSNLKAMTTYQRMRLCPYCGYYFVNFVNRKYDRANQSYRGEPLYGLWSREGIRTPTWQKALAKYKEAPPQLERY